MSLTPVSLGLPVKFPSFRQGQDDVAISLLASEKRFSHLRAQTGAGKSLAYMTEAKLRNARTLVLVGTKGLQGQVYDDFASIGMRDMRGQSNYRCVALERELSEYGKAGDGCDKGPCHAGVYCTLKKEGGCLYYDAQAIAREALHVITSYAYWMTLGRYSDPEALGKFDLLVMDEAHTAPGWLSSFCQVTLDQDEIWRLLRQRLPAINEGVLVWASWAARAAKIAEARYNDVKAELEEPGPNKGRLIKKLFRLNTVGRELLELSQAREWKRGESARRDIRNPGVRVDWVAEKTRNGILFSPVWAHAYAERYLYRGIERVVLSSATLLPEINNYLGIPFDQCDYHDLDSDFDPANSPFYYIPTTRVDYKMVLGQKRIWLNRIDSIIDGRLDRKAIIHTRSYDRARYIVENSRHSAIMLSNTWRNTPETVARFKRAPAPCILVTPSVEAGFDFPGDQCYYQIIAKVPFINMRSAVVNARHRSDPNYTNYEAAISLIQMSGRGTRSKDDKCETFIVDDHWKWFFRAAPEFPKWFLRRMRPKRTTVPKAISLQ